YQPLMTRGGGQRDLALGGRNALQEGQAEPLREGRRDNAAAGAVGGRHGDQTHGRAGPGVSGIGSHGCSSPRHAVAGVISGAASARRPGGSTSPHTIAAAAKMPAETQNATT